MFKLPTWSLSSVAAPILYLIFALSDVCSQQIPHWLRRIINTFRAHSVIAIHSGSMLSCKKPFSISMWAPVSQHMSHTPPHSVCGDFRHISVPFLPWPGLPLLSDLIQLAGLAPTYSTSAEHPGWPPSDLSLHLPAPGKFWNNLLFPDVARSRCLSFVLCSAETRSEFAASVHPNHLLKESFIHKPQA